LIIGDFIIELFTHNYLLGGVNKFVRDFTGCFVHLKNFQDG